MSLDGKPEKPLETWSGTSHHISTGLCQQWRKVGNPLSFCCCFSLFVFLMTNLNCLRRLFASFYGGIQSSKMLAFKKGLTVSVSPRCVIHSCVTHVCWSSAERCVSPAAGAVGPQLRTSRWSRCQPGWSGNGCCSGLTTCWAGWTWSDRVESPRT